MAQSRKVIPGISLLRSSLLLEEHRAKVQKTDGFSGYLCLARWDWGAQRSSAHHNYSIVSFKATYQVPADPAVSGSQTIFLFHGMQPSSQSPINSILQPVLQWGASDTGGGQFWSVASWFVKGSPGNLDVSVNTKPIRVDSGRNLLGLITLSKKEDGVFTYMCGFDGIDGTTISVQMDVELVQTGVALEAHLLRAPGELPNAPRSAFYPVQIGHENGPASPQWSLQNQANEFAQAVVQKHGSVEDEIDISYQK